jgi:DNA-binding NarL/FixJ family response regulator
LKRAVSAYKFAFAHKEEWPQKLNNDDRKKKQREGALKSAEVRKHDSTQKRELALQMRRDKMTYADIANRLNVSKRTVIRWCKR